MTLQEWLISRGYNFEPVLDGKVRRFSTEEDSGRDQAGWYIGSCIISNGKKVASITVGDWRSDEKEYFREGGFQNGDLEHYKQALEKHKKEQDEIREKIQKEASERAKQIWEQSGEANKEHPYLVKKEITPIGIRQLKDTLIIPVYIDDKISSLQRINPDGTKRFLSGGRMQGGYFKLDGDNSVVLLAEGYATAWSINQATGYETYVCFNAGNLPGVAKGVRVLYGETKQILICGDDDYENEKNNGMEFAKEAARSIGAIACFPEFGSDETGRRTPGTDFNDMYCRYGLERVKSKILSVFGKSEKTENAQTNQGEQNSENADSEKKEEKNFLEILSKPFPHEVMVNKKIKRLGTIENVKELLKRLGVVTRYNVISKKEEILIPGEGFTVDNEGNATLACIVSWCEQAGISSSNLKAYLTRISDGNLYNPVATWIESKEWDKKSRLMDLYNTIQSSDEKLKEIIIKRWMISAVAAIYEKEGVSAHGVLVLQGPQASGKTSWIKKLVPESLCVVADGLFLRPDDKDSVFQAISKWIVELGELDATFRKADIAQLKAFLPKTNDVIRRPYAATESNYARRTVFCGSVNEKDFLKDPTGNRRFWTIECEDINYQHEIDMQQLWAEVRGFYLGGEPWVLNAEELRLLNSHNTQFLSPEPIAEKILQSYDWDSQGVSWKSTSDICKDVGVEFPTNKDFKVACDTLRNKCKVKEKVLDGYRLFFVPPKKFSVF